jgi:methylmalonyl-CoA/ethylmalonyl-CoA epimerase
MEATTMKNNRFAVFLTFTFLILSVPIVPAQEKRVGFEISHHHVGISVPNVEESVAWYKNMLGFEEVTRMTQNGTPNMTIAHIRRGNCYIELFQVEGAKPLPDYRRDPTADLGVHGFKHMGLLVKDVHAAVKELKAKGVEIAMGPVDTPGVAFVFIRDNSGNALELIEYKSQKQ